MDNDLELPVKNLKFETDLVHQTNLFISLRALYETNTLCDVTLISGINGQQISAHRVILSAASPYFRAMFTIDMKEKQQAEIILNDIHGHDLKILIEFCYTSVIDINESNVYGLLEAATRMEFHHLEQKCYDFLSGNLSVSNCLIVWAAVDPFANLRQLVRMAVDCAEMHFSQVTGSHEFLLLESERLKILLESNDLNIWSEEEVFNALCKWIHYDENNRKPLVRELLPTIRLLHIRSEFLYDVVNSFCKKFDCSDIITDVFQWKLVPQSQLNPVSPRPSTIIDRYLAFGNDIRFFENNFKIDESSESYNPMSNKWSTFIPFSCERIGLSSLVVDNDLFIFGGSCRYDENLAPLNVAHKFNFTTEKLETIKPMKAPRAYFGVTALNNYIYAAGGDFIMKSVERFDINANEWYGVPSMLKKRTFFSLTTFGGRLFAAGGVQTDKNEYFDSVECYDPLKNKWEFVSSMNRPRFLHAAFVHNHRLYVVGGAYGNIIESSLEYYEPSIDKWTVIEVLAVPRYGFGLISCDKSIIIAGGRTFGHSITSSVIKINLDSFTPEPLASMKYERGYFNLVKIPHYRSSI